MASPTHRGAAELTETIMGTFNNQYGVSHTQRCCGINRNNYGYVYKIYLVNNDKRALNTSLDNVYCWTKIKIAYKYIYHGFSNSKRCYNCE